jgi:RNA polymerase sigma factor (sigma-70 family)
METTSTDAISTAIRYAASVQRPQLLALIRRRGGATAEAEDILQIAIERALTRSAQLRDPDRAEAWVARILRNVLIDELRKRREVNVSVDDLELATNAPEGFDCDCVLAQITELKPEYAELLRRVIIDGATITHVAVELGMTANNAMVRLHRARKALRAQLESHCGTTSASMCADCGCRERRCCSAS